MTFEKIVEMAKHQLKEFGENLHPSITAFKDGRVALLDPTGVSKEVFLQKARQYVENEMPDRYYVYFIATATKGTGEKEDVLTVLEYNRDSPNKNISIPYKIKNKKVTFGKPIEGAETLHSVWDFYPARQRHGIFKRLMGNR